MTLLDFDVPAMIGMMADPGLVQVAKWSSRRAGVLDGSALGSVFSWFRPNDLVWNYWVNNYLLGTGPSRLRHPGLECRFDQPTGAIARPVPGPLRLRISCASQAG